MDFKSSFKAADRCRNKAASHGKRGDLIFCHGKNFSQRHFAEIRRTRPLPRHLFRSGPDNAAPPC